MRITSRTRTIAFFITLGAVLTAVAIFLNVSWIIYHSRSIVPLILGIVFFAAIIAGLVVYTIFIVREIKRNERQDSFLNAVTHELKTPIASIRLYLETLQTRPIDEAQRREFYRIMLEDSERLLGTVEQVLKAGEARHLTHKRNWQEINFGAVVTDSLELTRLRHHLPPECLRFGSEPKTDLIVMGNPEELRTAVFNLFDNAVKYSGGNKDIVVDVRTPNIDTISLSVRDQGIGIAAPRTQTHLQSFLSRAQSRHRPGEGHRPRPLHRARRRTPLRWRCVRRKRRRRPGQHLHAHASAGLSRMTRILIVEDETHLAEGLRFNLEAEGHSVRISGKGEEALDLLLKKNSDFEALVLDVMLPGKDGFTVARELREAKNYIPLLMLTARGRPEDVLKGFESGADDYLPKPFNLAILLARLESLLRRKNWHQSSPDPYFRVGTDSAKRRHDIDRRAVLMKNSRSMAKLSTFNRLQLKVGKQTVQLTLMEAELLRYLIRSTGKPVSRKAILQDVWNLHEDTDTRAIDNFIVRLRRYIERDPTKPRHLLTVRGLGYQFILDPKK